MYGKLHVTQQITHTPTEARIEMKLSLAVRRNSTVTEKTKTENKKTINNGYNKKN